MGGIFRESFIRLLYTLIATAGVYVSLWNRADVAKDRFSARRSLDNSSYDFIVVGAGTGGAVLASRLSEKYNVLVLEAGGNPFPLSQHPVAALGLLNYPEIDWMHRTVPQKSACMALKNQESRWSQGKGLGGTSNIHYMIYSRGCPKDFDNWAKVTGDSTWSYRDVLPFFKKTEDFQGPYSGSGFHGKGGPTRVDIPPYQGSGERFVMAGEEFGYLRVDLNGNYSEGFDHIYSPIRNGRRQGTYHAYLKPALRRPSLTIEKFAHVTKVLLRGEGNEAYGVEYRRHGRIQHAYATKEVIISAGTLNSPKLLMLSGIGPRTHLESRGIGVKVDAPGVGQNLQDHVSTLVGPFFVKQGQSLLIERDFKPRHILEFYTSGTGPLTSTGLTAMGFLSSERAKSAGETDWPDLQFIYAGVGIHRNFARQLEHEYSLRRAVGEKYFTHVEGCDAFFITPALARPKQRGEVLLRSSNPNEKLLIDPKYLQNEEDVRVLLEGVKTAVELVESTPSFQEVRSNFTLDRFPGCEGQAFRSDGYWECYIRQFTISLNNYVGTCAMGPRDSKSAVVDTQLRVIGAKNLRVVDASVMPVLPSGNTYAPTLMIGEKAADMIFKQWSNIPPSPQQTPQRRPYFGLTTSGSGRFPASIQGNFNGRPLMSTMTQRPFSMQTPRPKPPLAFFPRPTMASPTTSTSGRERDGIADPKLPSIVTELLKMEENERESTSRSPSGSKDSSTDVKVEKIESDILRAIAKEATLGPLPDEENGLPSHALVFPSGGPHKGDPSNGSLHGLENTQVTTLSPTLELEDHDIRLFATLKPSNNFRSDALTTPETVASSTSTDTTTERPRDGATQLDSSQKTTSIVKSVGNEAVVSGPPAPVSNDELLSLETGEDDSAYDDSGSIEQGPLPPSVKTSLKSSAGNTTSGNGTENSGNKEDLPQGIIAVTNNQHGEVYDFGQNGTDAGTLERSTAGESLTSSNVSSDAAGDKKEIDGRGPRVFDDVTESSGKNAFEVVTPVKVNDDLIGMDGDIDKSVENEELERTNPSGTVVLSKNLSNNEAGTTTVALSDDLEVTTNESSADGAARDDKLEDFWNSSGDNDNATSEQTSVSSEVFSNESGEIIGVTTPSSRTSSIATTTENDAPDYGASRGVTTAVLLLTTERTENQQSSANSKTYTGKGDDVTRMTLLDEPFDEPTTVEDADDFAITTESTPVGRSDLFREQDVTVRSGSNDPRTSKNDTMDLENMPVTTTIIGMEPHETTSTSVLELIIPTDVGTNTSQSATEDVAADSKEVELEDSTVGKSPEKETNTEHVTIIPVTPADALGKADDESSFEPGSKGKQIVKTTQFPFGETDEISDYVYSISLEGVSMEQDDATVHSMAQVKSNDSISGSAHSGKDLRKSTQSVIIMASDASDQTGKERTGTDVTELTEQGSTALPETGSSTLSNFNDSTSMEFKPMEVEKAYQTGLERSNLLGRADVEYGDVGRTVLPEDDTTESELHESSGSQTVNPIDYKLENSTGSAATLSSSSQDSLPTSVSPLDSSSSQLSDSKQSEKNAEVSITTMMPEVHADNLSVTTFDDSYHSSNSSSPLSDSTDSDITDSTGSPLSDSTDLNVPSSSSSTLSDSTDSQLIDATSAMRTDSASTEFGGSTTAANNDSTGSSVSDERSENVDGYAAEETTKAHPGSSPPVPHHDSQLVDSTVTQFGASSGSSSEETTTLNLSDSTLQDAGVNADAEISTSQDDSDSFFPDSVGTELKKSGNIPILSSSNSKNFGSVKLLENEQGGTLSSAGNLSESPNVVSPEEPEAGVTEASDILNTSSHEAPPTRVTEASGILNTSSQEGPDTRVTEASNFLSTPSRGGPEGSITEAVMTTILPSDSNIIDKDDHLSTEIETTTGSASQKNSESLLKSAKSLVLESTLNSGEKNVSTTENNLNVAAETKHNHTEFPNAGEVNSEQSVLNLTSTSTEIPEDPSNLLDEFISTTPAEPLTNADGEVDTTVSIITASSGAVLNSNFSDGLPATERDHTQLIVSKSNDLATTAEPEDTTLFSRFDYVPATVSMDEDRTEKSTSVVQTVKSTSSVTTSRAISSTKSTASSSSVTTVKEVSAVENSRSTSTVNRSETTERQESSRSFDLGTPEKPKSSNPSDDETTSLIPNADNMHDFVTDSSSAISESGEDNNENTAHLESATGESNRLHLNLNAREPAPGASAGIELDSLNDLSKDRRQGSRVIKHDNAESVSNLLSRTKTYKNHPAGQNETHESSDVENSAQQRNYTSVQIPEKWIKVHIVYDTEHEIIYTPVNKSSAPKKESLPQSRIAELTLELTTPSPPRDSKLPSGEHRIIKALGIEVNRPSTKNSVEATTSAVDQHEIFATMQSVLKAITSVFTATETPKSTASINDKPTPVTPQTSVMDPEDFSTSNEDDSAEPPQILPPHKINGRMTVDGFSKLRKLDSRRESAREIATGDQRRILDLAIDEITKPRLPKRKDAEPVYPDQVDVHEASMPDPGNTESQVKTETSITTGPDQNSMEVADDSSAASTPQTTSTAAPESLKTIFQGRRGGGRAISFSSSPQRQTLDGAFRSTQSPTNTDSGNVEPVLDANLTTTELSEEKSTEAGGNLLTSGNTKNSFEGITLQSIMPDSMSDSLDATTILYSAEIIPTEDPVDAANTFDKARVSSETESESHDHSGEASENMSTPKPKTNKLGQQDNDDITEYDTSTVLPSARIESDEEDISWKTRPPKRERSWDEHIILGNSSAPCASQGLYLIAILVSLIVVNGAGDGL